MAPFFQRPVRQDAHIGIAIAERTHQQRSLIAQREKQGRRFLTFGSEWLTRRGGFVAD